VVLASVVEVGRGGSNRRRRRGTGKVQLPLDVESLLELTREALSSFAVEIYGKRILTA
jgi:hypothetical protein